MHEFAHQFKDANLSVLTALPEKLAILILQSCGRLSHSDSAQSAVPDSPRKASVVAMISHGLTKVNAGRLSTGRLSEGSGRLSGAGATPGRGRAIRLVTGSNTTSYEGPFGRISHMLLYLNEVTFVGDAGQVLAEEVRRARNEG
eukprot:1707733-Prymnesium_polylepis.1